ncbi:nucleoside hydrolase [Microbacterium immunditiarum]|uniref:Purine nucleosidase n=1 Tax=Microbacterium immunditiarum TaxID=337480 RepID=A0A7Y9GMS3_9MICO|nr:nucleoside hydrolase [Microbacterium immunditiarum]NYE19378.1 purine nucleosidase [Microbacterium immunditiarum]
MRPGPTPVFVDCDTGIDDALALAYLLAEPTVEVVGVGTVFGNTSVELATGNTLGLLELAGRDDIPVAMGAPAPLGEDFEGGARAVHGSDGVGGVGLAPHRLRAAEVGASDLLADLAATHPGRLRVLALGPLTNLARFVHAHPDRVGDIADVTVMGGAFDRNGNVSRVAEANIHNDPRAAAIVFDAPWPVSVVPLDITMRHVLTEREHAELAAIPGALPAVLGRMLHTYLDYYEDAVFEGERQCALHDPLAAVVAASGARIMRVDEPAGIDVATDGDWGRTSRRPGTAAEAVARRRIVLDVDRDAAAVLLEALRAWEWPD